MADVAPFSQSMQDQINALLNLSSNRIASQQPIHQAAMAMAAHLAPDYARAAMGPVPTIPAVSGGGGSASSGGGSGLPAALAMGGAAGLLKPDANGNIPLKDIINAIRNKLRGGNGQSGQNGLTGPLRNGFVPSGQPNAPWSLDPTDSGVGPYRNGYQFGTGMDPAPPWALFGGDPLLSDPGFWMGGGQPNDPSGGSGIGPGMQAFYDALRQSGGGSDPYGDESGTNWLDE